MVYRISYTRDKTVTHEAVPFRKLEDALARIRSHREKGLLDDATVIDHDGNRIEWAEIKKLIDPN